MNKSSKNLKDSGVTETYVANLIKTKETLSGCCQFPNCADVGSTKRDFRLRANIES